MAEEKVKTGIAISQEAFDRVKDMALQDVRNVSTEIEWLIQQECERRTSPTAPKGKATK